MDALTVIPTYLGKLRLSLLLLRDVQALTLITTYFREVKALTVVTTYYKYDD